MVTIIQTSSSHAWNEWKEMYMMRVCDTHLPFKQYFFCIDRRLLILICDLRPVALLQVTFYFFFISYNARGIHTHILPESFIELALPLLCVVRPTIFDRMEHTIFCFFFFCLFYSRILIDCAWMRAICVVRFLATWNTSWQYICYVYCVSYTRWGKNVAVTYWLSCFQLPTPESHKRTRKMIENMCPLYLWLLWNS